MFGEKGVAPQVFALVDWVLPGFWSAKGLGFRIGFDGLSSLALRIGKRGTLRN